MALTSSVTVVKNDPATVKAYIDATASAGDRVALSRVGSSVMIVIYPGS